MAHSTVQIGISESLGSRLDRWTISVSLSALEGFVISLAHPASAGLIIPTATTVESEAIAVGSRVLAGSTEIDVASAAPALEHPDLLLGLRTVAKMFRWECREVRAVAFLMFENGHLTHDETAWLSGYEGDGAPMEPQSPLG